MNALFIALIRAYKALISPLLGSNCRFSPSCSTYAIEALQKKGTLKGLWLSTKRLCKCHPFHPGGYDPVEPDH